MIENIPSQTTMVELVGQSLYEVWQALCSIIDEKYDEAETYYDGKWVMFEPTDTTEFADYLELLTVKRKSNRK